MRLPAVPSDNRFRVLVAEDDASIAKLVQVHIQKANFECILARDGVAAWTQFAQHDPHLVVTDINMPGLSGHELVEKIRQNSAVPIVMITAADSEDFEMRGFKVGADDYIAKPFNPRSLMARVVANLRRVYRYDTNLSPSTGAQRPSSGDDGVPSMGLPVGWGKCESCSYMGPFARFETRSSSGDRVTKCPNCGSSQIMFSV